MKWQPIETAPKDGTKILVFTIHGDFEITEWCVFENSHYEVEGNGLYRKVIDTPTEFWNGNNPKYWMPLPDAPNQDGSYESEMDRATKYIDKYKTR